MKIPPNELHCPAIIQFHRAFGCIAVFALTLLLTAHAFGQAPGLIWTTNVGATLFAVDADTNVYANTGGTVIKLDSSGQVLATNLLNARATRMQRDSAGNYYLCGITPWEFVSNWNFTNPACFLAKYSAGGGLIWSNNFGPTGVIYVNGIQVTDLQLLSDGTVYAGFWYRVSSQIVYSQMAKLDSAGSNVWTVGVQRGSFGNNSSPVSVRFGPLTATNGFVIGYGFFNPTLAILAAFENNGASGTGVNWASSGLSQSFFTKPGNTNQGDWFNVEGGNLVKRSPSGSLIATLNAIDNSFWIVSPDPWDGVYVGTSTNSLLRSDSDGKPAWTLNLDSVCSSMIVDPQGNRFLSTASGTVSRLGPEIISGPTITTNPAGKILFAGSNYVFSVGATGFGPLRYYWLFNGVPLSGKTNATLPLTNLSPAQTGNYSVIVSNFMNSVTSAPALLTVKGVALFLGSQMLTNGTYNFITPPTLSVLSAFPSGSKFYTTDGSPPSFASTFYTGPFAVSSSATIRAIGYSADFSQSEEADAVNIVLPPTYTLAVASTPGGNVTLNPPGGIYLSNTVVTVTAAPTNGWTFLYWLGDASGTSTSTNVTINANKSVQAVFGTALSTTVAGNGQVLQYPAGGVYPYGSVVRLTGVPQPGNYFGVWGNAASGNSNPLYFTITSPSPTVSSLFAATPAGQSALTVVITGRGQVAVNPRANAYATNQSVTLTATPDAGESFLRWSGDASGTVNPLIVSMDQGRVVVANFTGPFWLRADRPGIEGLFPQGFRFTVVGDPFATYQIFGSTNLSDWTVVGSVTNVAPESQFTDPEATNSPQKFYKALH